MKVGIVGNYGNDNNGDESILISIITQVEQVFSITRDDITVFSNNPQQTSKQYGVNSHPLYYKKGSLFKTFYHTIFSNRKIVGDLDLLIIGGGGILMDFYRREAHLFSTYGLMAKKAKVPFIVYGCGAGPLDTMLGKLMIRLLCKHAENVSVRDLESKSLLQRVGVKSEIQVIGDPAFTLHNPKKNHSKKPVHIGVSAVPIFNGNYWPSNDVGKYKKYVKGMAKNLDNLLANNDANITFFATKYPQDVDVTKDIQKKMKYKDRTTVLDENLKPHRLVEVTREFDLVIGTRLHSLILATATETPIIAISYHEKVDNFMKLVGLTNRCFSTKEIAKKEVILKDAFEEVLLNWESVLQQTQIISRKVYADAISGKQLMIKAVKDK